MKSLTTNLLKIKIAKNKYRSELFLILIISLVFACLYYKYIFGGDAYIFVSDKDIGNDQYYTYYPRLYWLINSIRNSDFHIYDFNLGFGMVTYTLYNVLLNPFDGILVLFGTDYLAYGLLFVTYLKYIWIGLFAYWYFKKLWDSNNTSIISSILWTFCSYNIVWGQHYFILTSMALFTSFVYGLHTFLQKEYKTDFILILIMSLFVIQSYYFFYMAGVFSILYILFYGWFTKKEFLYLFNKIFYLAIMAIIALMISSFMLMPIMYNFFNSARISGLLKKSDSIVITVKEFITILSRLLNPDILGGAFAVPFSGSLNYYEAPLLSVSVLMIPSIIYSFKSKENSKIKIALLLLLIFSLLFKICNLMFTFTIDAYRWCFIFDFIIVMTIGYFVDSKEIVNEKYLAVTSIMILIGLGGILLTSDYFGIVDVQSKLLLFYICFFVILMCLYIKYKGRKIIFVLIAFEIIVSYYPALNNRGTENYGILKTKGYEDGTKEVIEKLNKLDDSFYRISKTYDSVFYNDSYIQNYKGVRVYSSVNSKYLYNFFKENKISILFNHPNYLSVPYDNVKINGELSVKYFISKNRIADLKEVLSCRDYYVYKNDEYLPFGYLLDHNQIPDLDDSIQSLQKITFEGNRLEGRIKNSQEKEKKLLLTIPYSKKEYTVYMDGKKCETFVLKEGFLGIDVPPDEHTIAVVFEVPLLAEGYVTSLIGIAIYMVLIGNRYLINKGRLNKK